MRVTSRRAAAGPRSVPGAAAMAEEAKGGYSGERGRGGAANRDSRPRRAWLGAGGCVGGGGCRPRRSPGPRGASRC